MSKFTFRLKKINRDILTWGFTNKEVSVYANNEQEARVKALDKAGKGYKFYE